MKKKALLCNSERNVKMYSVSLCMIVKNEEDVIGRCLESVRGMMDEIIVVDTGSEDRTKEIVKQYTDKIYDFAWEDDFSAARNYSFSLATGDFVMWLDADDVILEEDRLKFMEKKEKLDPELSIAMMRYNAAFDERGKPTFSYYRERLFNRSMDFRWVGAVHEVIPLQGKIEYWDVSVTHRKISQKDPGRNLRILQKIADSGRTMDARQVFYYGRELLTNGKLEKAEEVLRQYLESGAGWKENEISACQDLAECRTRLGDEEGAFQALVSSFRYDRPRPEICCKIGSFFMKREDYLTAVYWFEQAMQCETDITSGGFFSLDSSGFIPAIQLCICWDKLGDDDKAYFYHKKSEEYRPENPSVIYNRKYFEKKMGEKTKE